ncbi:MAG: helix-turn-helix domain-containing protein [Muribaculaceae bacterium]|nr:helix-turn-helix domain-containing protein [Muribaculaceae bacterium]
MTFGQKLKKLRNENDLTQEQLADMIFVTRTAISKWETDNGYPSIDSLKAISNLFNISIDELISDADIENKKLLDKKNARNMYCIAIAFLGLTVLFTLLSYFLKISYFKIISMCGLIGYLAFALMSKPKYKRLQARKIIIPYVISRVVVFAVVLGVIIYTIVTI